MLAGEIVYLKYWYPGLTEWVRLTTTPPQVPVDTGLQLECAYLNRSTGRAIGHVGLTITKPNNTQVSLDAVENQDKEADPNHGWLVVFSPIVLDQLGSYQGKFTLSLQESIDAIRGQLASCWSYISGGGICIQSVSGGTYPIYIVRGGVGLNYSTCWGVYDTSALITGDEVWLYLAQACTLTYGGKSWNLVPGWNQITW